MNFKTKEDRDKFILDNMKLVTWTIKNKVNYYDYYDCTFEDLKSIGTIGLIKAVDKFNESKNVEFSTYAISKIYGEIRVAFRGVRNGIRYGRRFLQNKSQVDDMINIEKKTYKEIAEELNLSEKDVADINVINLKQLSLNSRVKSVKDDFLEYIDVITYKDDKEAKCKLYDLLNILDERNRKIVIESMVYGKTQTELATKYGVSQVQIGRIINKSIEKLRKVA